MISVASAKNKEKEHEYVDLGLSVKWATCNVGATTPDGYGDFFAWGDPEPYYEPGYATSKEPVWKPGKSEGYNDEVYKYYDNDYHFIKYNTKES